MNLKKYVLASLPVVTLLIAGSSFAQMRTNCFEDPAKPGACFAELAPGGLVVCEEGAIRWFPAGEYNEKNQFARVNPSNPDGTVFVHNSARELAIGFCFWEDILAGNCSDESVFPPIPLEGAYVGTASFKVNGLLNPETGDALCPFVLKGKGMASNTSRQTMVEVDAVLHLVRDASGGCNVKQCQIIAPDQ